MAANDASETARLRRRAATILDDNREEIIRRWLRKARLLTREKGVEHVVGEQALRDQAHEFIDMLVGGLSGAPSETEGAAFYHLILDGRQYRLRLADLAYFLLELKSVSKQVTFERVTGELEAFRISRLVDDAIEAVLRRSADLYELVSEADQKTAQDRLREVFAAWDLEGELAGAQTQAEVCATAFGKLRLTWRTTGLYVCLCGVDDEPGRELREGSALPLPMAAGGVPLPQSLRAGAECVICRDVSHSTVVTNAAELLDAGVQSLACCPLATQGRAMGALLLFGGEPDVFVDEDRRTLRDFAGVLSLALDRTGRLEHSRKQISEAEVIARIGRSLLELPTRDALLEGAAEALRAFRDYFDVSLFRVDAGTGECRLAAEAGRGRRFRPPGYTQKVGTGFIGLCAQTGRTIRSTDLDGDARRFIAFEKERLARSELAVPVKRGTETLGVMHFLSDRENDFPDSEIAALEHVAPHIGVALMNARMLMQRHHDRYELDQAHYELATIVRSAEVGITSTAPNGIYTHWSPSCEDILGYTEDEVVGRLSPGDFAAEPFDLAAALGRCLQEGRVTSERRLLHKDGRARVVRETRVPMEDEDGRHIGYTSYLMDITEQKRAEDAVKQELETLNLVVEAMGAGLARYDRDMRLQWANRTMMQWFDFASQTIGKPCREVYGCGDEHSEDCPLRRACATGQPQTRVVELTDESGAWHCFQEVCTPVSHGDTRLVVLTLDITEQRRQTEQMALINKLTEKVDTSLELDRVLHLVLTCMTAGHAIGFNRAFIFLADDAGENMEGRMAVGPVSAEDAHRIWEGMAGREQTIEELLGSRTPSRSDRILTQRIRSLRIPFAELGDTLASTLNSRTSAHVGDARSDPHMHPQLTARLALEEFVCVPLVGQDEPIGLMIADNKYSRNPIGQNLVELIERFGRQASLAIANARAYQRIREQLEELHRTRDKLIEAERMASVGRMASHLAHEIRNPLTAIGGFAASIARQHRDDAATHRKARIIYDEVRRLERTLVNVLDYTRPLRPDKRAISVNEIVQGTVDQFRSQLEQAGVRLRLELVPDLPPVMADSGMLKQVIMNLVKNAMECMAGCDGAELSIVTSADGESVRIVVADNGSGMAPETVQELFSPFFSTKIGGIGLGLSVSQRIMRQHGGTIEVESRLGAGSRFIVTIGVGAGLEDDGRETVHSAELEPGKGDDR